MLNIPVDRLGVPSLNLQDGPQGWRTIERDQIDQVTSWPCSLGVAATWDVDRVYEYAQALAVEFKGKGANNILGPSVDLGRVARNGRNAESIAGEDPYFSAQTTSAYVRGIQENGIMATIKHFILNNQENNRNFYNSIADERTLWEIYYPAYEAAVEANVAAVMCSYNRVAGTYACEQPDILKRDLRDTMGFKGFVMSDWWATKSTDAANQGLDQEQPGNRDSWFDPDQLANEIGMAQIDENVLHILTPAIDLGILDTAWCSPPNCNQELYGNITTSVEHQNLARAIAGESIVLLKNDRGVLPLQPGTRVAVVGSACDARNQLVALSWDQGSYYVVGGSGRVLSSRATSIVAGIRAQAQADGVEVFESLNDNVENAVAAAASADVVLICAGTTSTEDRDRADLSLDQDSFVRNVLAQVDIPSVVAMSTPGAVMTEWKDSADAIVNMFLGGEASGEAWADMLLGKVNPSGRLPVTFPDSYDQTVAPCPGTGNCVYDEGLFVGYRALDNAAVSFPFGHGISYTTFEYAIDSDPAPCVPTLNRAVCFSVTVSNTGPVAGAEVVQVYLAYPAVFQEPPHVLRGFKKVVIGAGETVNVGFELTEKDMSIWNTDERAWSVADGSFTVFVGASSGDLRLEATFGINGDIVAPPDTENPLPGDDDDDSDIVFEEFLGTGCSNWQDITITQYEPGQGNCAAFCISEPLCKAYNVGVTGMPQAGKCALFSEGCSHQEDSEWDLYTVQ
jgi:beta-glucosidase